ncbi:ATP-binding cassette domain-containing protein [Streptomyces sp. NBC_00005]|uniref:ATP-binding cassette domain-containing protein n=1 Tax=Streptomyces sp. NBC_00005 TaxID=2903609 RepID=UPI003254F29A
MINRIQVGADRGRPARSLAAAGLVLAVVAELSSVGLFGLSGWFISACAVAGAATFSSFSYISPSGGVRAFALARTAGNYSTRLTLHAAALKQVSTARSDMFDNAATADRARMDGVWSGELLHRSMDDADNVGMALIRSTAPIVVTAAITACAIAAVALATSVAPAAVLAAGVAIATLIAYRTPGAARAAEQHTRKALRAELVTAVDAWTEMASLGAGEQLAARTTAKFTRLDTARATVSRRQLGTMLITALVGVATLAATMAWGARTRQGPATFVFVALMAVGVLAQAQQLPAAAEARATAAAAHHRLTAWEPSPSSDDGAVPAMTSWTTEQDVGFADYLLPPMALRPGRVLDARVARGAMLVVTGRSGSGKSTLLRALASSLHRSPASDDGRPAVTAVAADDYLFAGTLGSNWRLADPTLTDEEIDARLAELRLSESGLTVSTPVGPGGRQLSGGELRRVYLGRALATRPHVLIVDEPTTGPDDQTARHILGMLADLPDTTVVIATHHMPTCLATAGQVSTLPLA